MKLTPTTWFRLLIAFSELNGPPSVPRWTINRRWETGLALTEATAPSRAIEKRRRIRSGIAFLQRPHMALAGRVSPWARGVSIIRAMLEFDVNMVSLTDLSLWQHPPEKPIRFGRI